MNCIICIDFYLVECAAYGFKIVAQNYRLNMFSVKLYCQSKKYIKKLIWYSYWPNENKFSFNVNNNFQTFNYISHYHLFIITFPKSKTEHQNYLVWFRQVSSLYIIGLRLAIYPISMVYNSWTPNQIFHYIV